MTTTTTPNSATLTHAELASLLRGTRGATILSLSWVGSDPARRKADKGRITKVSRYSGMVNPRYDRKKAKSLGIPTEEVEVTPCGWLDSDGSCISTHNGGKNGSPLMGTEYITFYPQSGHTDYTLDGAPCERGDVAELVRPPSRGTVANFRRITLSGVTGATINGTTYDVVADPPEYDDEVDPSGGYVDDPSDVPDELTYETPRTADWS